MHLDPTAVLAQFLGSIPTFIALVLAWMRSNSRIVGCAEWSEDEDGGHAKQFEHTH